MRDETVAGFLRQLAARTSAPGGGAAAALEAAQAAALIAMVARFSDGPRHDAAVAGRIIPTADGLIDEALALATADAAAFGKVTAAYQLPRQSPQEQGARSAAIAHALVGASRPQADLLLTCTRLTALAEDLLPTANRSLLGDLAAAASCIRAAADTARVNIEANLSGAARCTPVAGLEPSLTTAVADAAGIIVRADHLTAAAREALAR